MRFILRSRINPNAVVERLLNRQINYIEELKTLVTYSICYSNQKKSSNFNAKKIPETNPFGAMPQHLTAGMRYFNLNCILP